MTTFRRGDVVLSLVTGIIRTIKHSMIERKLGTLRRSDRDAFDRELAQSGPGCRNKP